MVQVGLKSVRYYPALFIGAFLTTALGVALMGVAVTALAATWSIPVPTAGPHVTVVGAGGSHVFFRDAVDMQGITTILTLAAVVSGFVMVTNVAGTFAFSIACRRRDLGLLRLLGTGGWQIRRIVLAEALGVAMPAAAIGCLFATLVAPPTIRALNHTTLTPVQLSDHERVGALIFAYGAGTLLAVLAAFLASSRAAVVRPAEALRDAVTDAHVMTRVRCLIGGLTLTAGAVMLSAAPFAGALNATPLAIFGTFALTIAATALGPVYLPALIRLVGAPLGWLTTTSGGLAAASVATSRRRTSSLAAPVLSIMAVTGIMMGVLETTNATSLADQLVRIRAQLVVEPATGRGLDAGTLRRVATVPGVRTVSAPATLKVAFATPDDNHGQPGTHGGSGMVTANAGDLLALAATQKLRVVEGKLTRLTGNQIAVRQEFISWYDVHAGSTLHLGLFDGRTVDVTVTAIIDGGSSLPQMMLAPALAGAQAAPPEQANVLLDVPAADLAANAARLAAAAGPSRVRVTSVSQWYAARAADQERLQQLVLLVLVGPASLFALVAIASITVMTYSRRGREITGMTLLGVSRGQVRRMVMLEALLVTCMALCLAALFVAIGLAGYRDALQGSYLDTAVGVPWSALCGLAVACIVVAVATSLLVVERELHRPAVAMIGLRE